MPVSVNWHPTLEGVLVMQIQGDPTLEETLAVTRREGEMILGANRVVSTIIDARELGQVPKGFLGIMPQLGSMPAARHRNSGRKIVVGVGGVGGTLLSIFSKLYHKLYFFPSMEEAEEFIVQHPTERK